MNHARTRQDVTCKSIIRGKGEGTREGGRGASGGANICIRRDEFSLDLTSTLLDLKVPSLHSMSAHLHAYFPSFFLRQFSPPSSFLQVFFYARPVG